MMRPESQNSSEPNPRPRDLGLYVYQGNHQWASYSGSDVGRLLRLTDPGVFQ